MHKSLVLLALSATLVGAPVAVASPASAAPAGPVVVAQATGDQAGQGDDKTGLWGLLGLLGLGGLYFVPIPAGNREPLLLALGLVLGWGSTVVGYEFGSSPAARKAADAGIKHKQGDAA